jgi:hypothetical protein
VVPVAASTAASASRPEIAANATLVPAAEREALVLEAVRVLVRATASEIAERSGQPNGSVAVALRGLVARSQVAKTRTARGAEYSLVSTGSVRPFKRARAAGDAGGAVNTGGAPMPPANMGAGATITRETAR